MKNILGHKSYNSDEIIDILCRTGTYTCPTLPHYRYERVQSVCKGLLGKNLLRVSGKTEVSRNLVVTERFKEWQEEFATGVTKSGPIKWVKQKYPAKKPQASEGAGE